MSDATPTLGLPLILPSQAQKHVTHNMAISKLDRLVQLSAQSRSVATPPGSPTLGTTYIVGAGGSGAWAGQDHSVATWDGDVWAFATPGAGWRAYVQDEAQIATFDGATWGVIAPDLDNLTGVGINASSDLTNRLSVAADATLLSHDGAGHQVKVNKAGAGDTASVLYQTGFSGRAEMGLTGDDDFHVKVSADGSAWSEALVAEGGTGLCRTPGLLSGRVNIAPDQVVQITPPTVSGFCLIHNTHAVAPQPAFAGMFAFDIGGGPRLDTVYAGAKMENHDSTVLDGTISAVGNIGMAAQSGHLQVENRNTATEDFTYLFLGGN